jgi:hypothetical protein
LFFSKSGNFRKFDFISDDKKERTYDKLKSIVLDLSKLY